MNLLRAKKRKKNSIEEMIFNEENKLLAWLLTLYLRVSVANVVSLPMLVAAELHLKGETS
jgi:hypothetical protein